MNRGKWHGEPWVEVTPSGCWFWLRCRDPNGYGQMRFNGKGRPAHCVAYEQLVGPIPNGLELDHLCRNRSCVNPAHLEAVTRRENVRRGVGLPAQRARQTHCTNGHLLTEERNSIGQRRCKVCQKAWMKANRHHYRATA